MIRWDGVVTTPKTSSSYPENCNYLQQQNDKSQHPDHVFHNNPLGKGALHWASPEVLSKEDMTFYMSA
jgi:hypothetical protein